MYMYFYTVTVKVGSQYDAGASIALQASEWHWSWLKFNSTLFANISHQSTNQIVYKFDIANRIWLVDKYLSHNVHYAHDACSAGVILWTALYCVSGPLGVHLV